MNTITTLIPQYGELNRISKDWIVSHTFSFEKQKFIVDFYSEWSDIKAFEQAILELVLHTPPGTMYPAAEKSEKGSQRIHTAL